MRITLTYLNYKLDGLNVLTRVTLFKCSYSKESFAAQVFFNFLNEFWFGTRVETGEHNFFWYVSNLEHMLCSFTAPNSVIPWVDSIEALTQWA